MITVQYVEGILGMQYKRCFCFSGAKNLPAVIPSGDKNMYISQL